MSHMMNTQTHTLHGVRVSIDEDTGEVVSILDALTRQPARLFHSAYAISAAVRFAQESVFSLAELG
jgi:hypothetical protein